MKHTIKLLLLWTVFQLTSGYSEMAEAENTNVRMETSKGTIMLELYNDEAPQTVENFVSYAQDGFFDGTIFHRVIPDFMLQGGGFTADMSQEKNTSADQKRGQ